MQNISETLPKIIVSKPNPDHDATISILNELMRTHRDLFDVFLLLENRPNRVSDVMRARLYIIDNCIVRTYQQIDSDFLRDFPVFKDLTDSFGSPVVRSWTPNDVRGVCRCSMFVPPIR